MRKTEQPPAEAKLLVCDDSPTIRASLVRALQSEYTLFQAQDGAQAWDILQADPDIDVLITDLEMPVVDGYSLLTKIRASADPRIRNIPVIVVAGVEDTAARERVFNAGANDFIAKTSDRVELVARVRAHYKLAQTIRELEESRSVLREQANTDALTRLTNRRSFFERAQRDLALATRGRRPFSVLMIDIDHFKSINDTYGHQAGDHVLREVSRILEQNVRDTDVLARVGGEEFAVALPMTNRLAAVVLAERLRKGVENGVIEFEGKNVTVTISLGLASLHQDGETVDQLLATADRRLYLAKQRGRNRFCASDKVADQVEVPERISIDSALLLLQHGNLEQLQPHLLPIMIELLPLLDAADQKHDLGMDLAGLRARLEQLAAALMA